MGALSAGGAARADLITTPDGFGNGFELANWYVGCDFEYACGNDFVTVGNTATTYTDFGTIIATGPSGENFAYTETDNIYGQTIDYTLTNLGSVSGPLTFTFASDSTPYVEGFGTTLYSTYGNFNATVSAYDAQGNLIGTTTASSAPNDASVNYLACEVYSTPCYSTFVGIQDTSAGYATIASVVVSTVANVEFSYGPETIYNDFDPGEVGVIGQGVVPEPGTFALMFLALAGIFTSASRLREKPDLHRTTKAKSPRYSFQPVTRSE
jgi:hypothetical protein